MSKFRDLTEQDKVYIKIVHADKSLPFQTRMDILKNKFGVAERAIRVWVQKLGYSKYQEIDNEEIRAGKIRGHDSKKKVKIITWAQNATPIHEAFFKNILAYADFRDAEVFVINGRYQNPNSLYSDTLKKLEWWDPKLIPYLCGSRITAHKDLQIMGDVPIVATAEDPLSGLEGMSGGKSCVVGHPRVHLRSLPVLNGHHRKIMMTTGAVTLSNYTDTKLGKKGEFHHTYGFAIVEIKDDEIHYVRQVTATPEGTFTDLIYNVDGEVYEIDSAAAFIFGDLHGDDAEEEVVNEARLFFNKVRPEKVFLHDAINGGAINRHELNDPIVRYKRFQEGKHLIGGEVERLIELIDKYDLTDYNLHIVRSNHDVFLEKWIQEADWKKDIPNSKEYLEYSLALISGKAPKGVLPYLLERHFGKKIKCLDLDDSVVVHDFELAQHGHLGSNGSRGGMEVFRKLNTKMIVGHGHCLPLEYQVQFRDRGWGEIKTAKLGDYVLSYNPEEGRNEWCAVDEYMEYEYSGVMIRIAGNGFEQTFTAGHHLMMRDGSYIPATEAICVRSANELPLTARAVSGQGIRVPEMVIRRIVAIAADGSIDSGKHKNRVRFHFKKDRKVQRLQMLFGEDIVQYNTQSGDFDGYIPMNSKSIGEVREYKRSLVANKHLSNEVLNWDSESLEILQEELSYWDGSFGLKDNSRQWSTIRKKEANIVMSVLVRLGYSCTMNKRAGGETNRSHKFIVTWCVNREVVRTTKSMNHESRFPSWGFSSYNTPSTRVACLSVKNRCFWIRSDKTGNVSLTGNSINRRDGVLMVGTNTVLRAGYNHGASDWGWADGLVHHDKKAQHLIFSKDKKFTTIQY